MNKMNMLESFRWDDYFLAHGKNFDSFWSSYLKNNKKIFFILGCGFDPRMCDTLEKLSIFNENSTVHCFALDFDEGPSSPSLEFTNEKSENLKKLSSLESEKISLEIKKIKIRDDTNTIKIRQITKLFSSLSSFSKFTDIVIDISSFPLYLYFPLIAKILNILDKAKKENNNKWLPNLHVVVSENAELDQHIVQKELEDESTLVYPFQANVEIEDAEKIPKIWIPLIGENQELQIPRIATMLKPDEIIPIFPSVSQNPRRGDTIYLKYKEIFDKLAIDHRNIIYGAEQNPFEVYREIFSTIIRFRRSLSKIGSCKIALSSLSSKLLSMSAFLVAYEAKQKNLEIAIAQVFSKGFSIDTKKSNSLKNNSELFFLNRVFFLTQ